MARDKTSSFLSCAVLLMVVMTQGGCSFGPPPAPNELVSPRPIPNNSGKFMAPYTKDDVLTPWVTKAINTSAAASIGGTVGAMAGQQALNQIPFVGGIVGNMAGNAIGREIAIKAAGGMSYIEESSDQSFATIDDLAVWMYVNHSTHEDYQSAFKATSGIYPDLNKRYIKALKSAPRKLALGDDD
ncbi:MAG: hypothetical protein AAF797_00845 [Planctomycetota bacterium]